MLALVTIKVAHPWSKEILDKIKKKKKYIWFVHLIASTVCAEFYFI